MPGLFVFGSHMPEVGGCVVWEEGGWGPGGKRCGAFQKDRFLWEISPEIKVLSAEIRVRKYTYNRREILIHVWAKLGHDKSGVAPRARVLRWANSIASRLRPNKNEWRLG